MGVAAWLSCNTFASFHVNRTIFTHFKACRGPGGGACTITSETTQFSIQGAEWLALAFNV